MIFVYKNWERFCKNLKESGILSVPARSVTKEKYLVLKHDVETKVENALRIAEIESKYGHRGSYYVQAYLLENPKNIEMLKEIKDLGHEVSYHYDVMDSCKGDIEKAIDEFSQNLKLFEQNGFVVETVCQHGNPVVERVGYTSNRDFFRSKTVKQKYPHIFDIMVDFKQGYDTEYTYFSDAGRKFKLIFDPINDDLSDNSDKNISFDSLNELIEYFKKGNCIISTHPHRWVASSFKYIVQTIIFKVIRFVAKILIKIPIFKKIMSRYYYLAKKI